MQIGTYIKLILQKKGWTYQQLADRLSEPDLAVKGRVVSKHRIGNIVIGAEGISPRTARRIEIALDLPKYSLVEIVGFPTNDRDKRKLEELG